MREFFCLCTFLGLGFQSYSQTPAYRDKVKTLMEINGSQETFDVAITSIMEVYKSSETEVPQEVWEELEAEFKATTLQELVELLVPVYHRHLPERDLDAIISFFQSPAGQILAEKTPIITEESMIIGREWGKDIGLKVKEQLRERGY